MKQHPKDKVPLKSIHCLSKLILPGYGGLSLGARRSRPRTFKIMADLLFFNQKLQKIKKAKQVKQAASVAFRSTSVASASLHLRLLIKAALCKHQQLVLIIIMVIKRKKKKQYGMIMQHISTSPPTPLQTSTACLWSLFHLVIDAYFISIFTVFLFVLWHFGASVWQSISPHYHLSGNNYRQEVSYNSVRCCVLRPPPL